MNVRQFKLINSKGASFNLMRRDALFYVPDGLGFSMDSEYMQIGNSYQLIDTEASQKVVSGTMVFDSYAIYEEFVNFIAFTPLKLAYKPLNEWAYLDCSVSNLSKSEIDYTDRKLKCNIDFTATSKWYIPRRAERTSPEVANGKRYTYTYDYQYAETLNGIIRITNNSSEDSPCIITIFGQIVNPTWSLIVANKVVASGQVSGTIEDGNKLVINSKDNQLEIAEYQADGTFVQNRYQDSDFTRENFIYIPNGQSTLLISSDVATEVNAYIEVEEIHETI